MYSTNERKKILYPLETDFFFSRTLQKTEVNWFLLLCFFVFCFYNSFTIFRFLLKKKRTQKRRRSKGIKKAEEVSLFACVLKILLLLANQAGVSVWRSWRILLKESPFGLDFLSVSSPIPFHLHQHTRLSFSAFSKIRNVCFVYQVTTVLIFSANFFSFLFTGKSLCGFSYMGLNLIPWACFWCGFCFKLVAFRFWVGFWFCMGLLDFFQIRISGLL